MSPSGSPPKKGHTYGVRLVRGPFVNLTPNSEHYSSDDIEGFLKYTAALRRRGERLAADFFSGAGGLSLGLERAGYKVVFGADHDPSAIRTHSHHFGGMSVDWDLSDALAINNVANICRAAEVDLIAGGPPCQPFSKAGRSGIRHRVETGQRDPYDERRDLWRSFLEIVQLVRPRAVVMENVPDMALDREMFILRSIVEELEQLGYSVEERVVEAWRYGVPQIRQRLILVALRNNLRFTWPAESTRKVTVWNAIGDLDEPEILGGWRPEGGADGWAEYSGLPQGAFQTEMREGISTSDSGKVFDHITRPVRDDDREAFEKMTYKTKYTDLSSEHQRYRKDIFDDKYKRLNENDLSRTITAHIAKDGYWYIHPRQSRTLTVREAARIQTFPDRFRFDGPPSAAFRQIGNAVPPRLAYAIGQAVLGSLEDPEDAGINTRQTSKLLADWIRGKEESLALPWLRAETRWQFIAGEVLLDRASPRAIRSFWRVLKDFTGSASKDARDADLAAGLLDMARAIGRTERATKILELADQVVQQPDFLDGTANEIRKLAEVPESVADLAVLAVERAASDEDDGGAGEEPILINKGVLRVARRFQANEVDRKNKMTDGRLAVARMVGFGADARDAQLALIELANSLCRPEMPLCSECPLSTDCRRDGVSETAVLL
ncbi:MAG: DNA cytosine methyltransferase [Candidatus Nanopelagicales bacterium]